jgi:hypothetical protein
MELVKPKKSISKPNNSVNAQAGDAYSSSGLHDKVLSQKSSQIRAEPSENNWILNELNAQKNEINLEKEFGLIDEISAFLKETSPSPRLNMDIKREIEAPPRELIHLKSSMFVETTIQSLPTEILCKIMDYLDFNDRKVASLVCKKWRNSILESYFLKDILIKANNHLLLSRPSSSSLSHPSLPLNSTANLSVSNQHRAASSMVPSSTFNIHLYSNVVNLEFENDSADVSLLLNNLKAHADTTTRATTGLLPKLKNLKFFKTTMSSKSLVEMFDEAPKLKTLNIIQCDSLFMTGFLTLSLNTTKKMFNLSNLTELCLSRNRYLTDFLLNLFLCSAPNLEKLDISFCSLTKSNYKSLSNSSQFTTNSTTGSTVVLTVENLTKELGKMQKLKSVNLGGIELFNHDNSLLSGLINSLDQLEEVSLANLPTLKVESVRAILNKLENLNSIDLNGSIQVDDSNLKSVEYILEALNSSPNTTNQTKLVKLKLNKAKINDPEQFLKQVSRLNCLTYLDLSCVMFRRSFGTAAHLNQYIENFAQNLSQCQVMEHLLLSYCDFLVTDSFIKIISKKMLKLKHLDLRNCTKITDQSLHYISKHLTELVHLDLSWCSNISDNGLDSSVEYSKDKRLLQEFNKHMNGSCRCMRKYTEQPFLLLKTKAELALEIKKQFCNCKDVTTTIENTNEQREGDEVQENILNETAITLKNLKNLKVLRLENCINITDIGLYNGINFNQLSELDLKLCTNVNGDFIFGSIERSELVAGATASYSLRNLKLFNSLKVLNLNQCIKFKEDNLMRIIENSPNLKELSISAITTITNNTIDLLLRLKKLLILLDVSFCPSINEANVDKYEQYLNNEFGSREFKLDKRFVSK